MNINKDDDGVNSVPEITGQNNQHRVYDASVDMDNDTEEDDYIEVHQDGTTTRRRGYKANSKSESEREGLLLQQHRQQSQGSHVDESVLRIDGYEEDSKFHAPSDDDKRCLPWVQYNLHLMMMCFFQLGWSAQTFLYYSLLLPYQVSKLDGGNSDSGNESRGKQLALILVFGSIISIVLPPIIGVYSDHYRSSWGRRRPFLAVGAFINIIGLVITALSTEGIALLVLGNVVTQIGMSFLTTSFNAIVPSMVEKERFGTTSGIIGAYTVLGFVIGTTFGMLLSSIGVAWTYMAMAVFSTFCTVITFYNFSEESSLNTEERKITFSSFFSEMWTPLKEHDFFWVCMSRFMVQMGVNTVQQFLSFWVADVIPNPDLSTSTETSLLFLPMVATSIVSAIVIGRLSDAMKKRKIFLIVSGCSLGVFSLCLIGVHSFISAIILCSIFGFGIGTFLALDFALIYDVLPDSDNYARDLGVCHISVVLPQVIASPIAGAILDSFNKDETFKGYDVLFSLSSICFFLASYMFVQLRSVD